MKLKFYLIYAAVPALLSACSHYENNAPVFSNNSNVEINPKPPSEAVTPLPAGKQTIESKELPKIAVEPTKSLHFKHHVVMLNETLYSIGVSTGLGFERLAMLNNIAKPYAIHVGQKIKTVSVASDVLPANAAVEAVKEKNISSGQKLKITAENKVKTQEAKKTEKEHKDKKVAPKITKSEQKSSIISIDNEKMLKLNFQWPVRGKVVKNFPQTNNKGIDIAGDIGHLVIASSAGKVAYSGQGLIGFGKVLIIKHNERFLSAYANIDQISVNEGQQIEKGQQIAKISFNGSKKATLHFEIRKNGKPVNPLKYLP